MKKSTRLGLLVVALAVGGAGIAVTALSDPRRALLAWLAAFGFGVATCLGALVLAMVFHVTNARWPIVVRPHVMAVASAIPVFAILFLPIAAGLHTLRPALPDDPAFDHQRLWQSAPFFFGRAALYFVVWIVVSVLLARADARHDREPTEANAAAQRRLSGAGLPAIALTLTFASFDWLMAIEPGWVSDMYGLYFFASGLVAAIAIVAVSIWLAPPVGVGPDHFVAIGRLMLMGTILWAYIAFFQLLLVWIANLPREVGFYALRSEHGYAWLSGVLVIGRFVLPFMLLLSRSLKRRIEYLAAVAVWLVMMGVVDLDWLVLPRAGGGPSVLDLAPFLVVGAIGTLFASLRPLSRPQAGDPTLAASLRYRAQ